MFLNPKISIPKIFQMMFLVFAALSFVNEEGASAQNFSGAFEGMRDNREPVQIESDSLEVQDNKGIAYFKGNVTVIQGSTILKTSNLTVYYSRDGNSSDAAGNVRRIVANGKVAVRSNDQRATANSADVDMVKQIAVLNGGVTVSQGKNIVTGEKLVINMKTNAANLTGGKSKRPSIVFSPRSSN